MQRAIDADRHAELFVSRYGAFDRGIDGKITDPREPIICDDPHELLSTATCHIPIYGATVPASTQVARPIGLRWGGITWWLSQCVTRADIEGVCDVVADGGYIAIRRRMGGWALGDTTTGMFAIATTDGFRRSSRYWTPPPDDSGWMDNELDRNPFVERDSTSSDRVRHYPKCVLYGDGSTEAVTGSPDGTRRRYWCPTARRAFAHAWSAQRAKRERHYEEANARERDRRAERRDRELTWARHEPVLVTGHATRHNAGVTHALDLNDACTVGDNELIWPPVCGAPGRGVVLDDVPILWANAGDRRRCTRCLKHVERLARRRALILSRSAASGATSS